MNFDTNTYFELNGTLVRFWKDQGITDQDLKITYLERLLNWYKKKGNAVQDKENH
jgi:hypothetical protein